MKYTPNYPIMSREGTDYSYTGISPATRLDGQSASGRLTPLIPADRFRRACR